MDICVNAVTLNDHRKSIAFQISSTAIRQCLKTREIFFLIGVVQLHTNLTKLKLKGKEKEEKKWKWKSSWWWWKRHGLAPFIYAHHFVAVLLKCNQIHWVTMSTYMYVCVFECVHVCNQSRKSLSLFQLTKKSVFLNCILQVAFGHHFRERHQCSTAHRIYGDFHLSIVSVSIYTCLIDWLTKFRPNVFFISALEQTEQFPAQCDQFNWKSTDFIGKSLHGFSFPTHCCYFHLNCLILVYLSQSLLCCTFNRHLD